MTERSANENAIAVSLQTDPFTDGLEVSIEGSIDVCEFTELTPATNIDAITQSSAWLLDRVFFALSRDVLKRHGSELTTVSAGDKLIVSFSLPSATTN